MKHYTVAEYSEKSGISKQAVYKRIERGSIHAIKDGSVTLIPEDQLQEQIRSMKEPEEPPGNATQTEPDQSDLISELRSRIAEKDKTISDLQNQIERNRQDYIDMLKVKDEQIRQADERLREAHIIASTLQLTDGRRQGFFQRLFGKKTDSTT